MTTDFKIARVNDLSQLRLLLTQDENGLRQYVCSRLRMGDVWWIPDDVSGFGGKERHPWVIVRGFSEARANVLACPRTTNLDRPHRGIVTPAGSVPGLDREGYFLLVHRQSFVARRFRDFEYVGQLPEQWIEEVRQFYRTMAEGKMAK